MDHEVIPNDHIRWRFEALAAWHYEHFGQSLPYILPESNGDFILSDERGNPIAPVKDAIALHELIVLTCAACGIASPFKNLCIDCAKHQENCCQCRLSRLKDERGPGNSSRSY